MADPVFVDDVTPLNAVNMNKLQTRDEEGQPNGYASLGSDGKVPPAQLPVIPAPGADLDYLGDYAPGTYVDGDIVVKDGIAYMCVGGPTVVPPNPVPWGPAGMGAGYAPLDGTNRVPAVHKAPMGLYTAAQIPASPLDGQEIILVPVATVAWHLRYNAGSPYAFKWEYIGGTPLFARNAAQVSTASGSYVDLGGPQIALPCPGDWEVDFGAGFFYPNAAGGSAVMSVGSGGYYGVADVDAIFNNNSQPVPGSAKVIMTGIGSTPGVGGIISCFYRLSAPATSASFHNRWLSIRPIRVAR